jgi:Protein of unknown function (DUF2950)
VPDYQLDRSEEDWSGLCCQANRSDDFGDFAKAAGYTNAGDKPQAFSGYLFRILTRQGDKAPGGAQDFIVNGKMTGGFAILAYPAEYRNSGIMTFVIGKDGIVYQKDLGEKTTDVASALADYNPRDGWTLAIQMNLGTG